MGQSWPCGRGTKNVDGVTIGFWKWHQRAQVLWPGTSKRGKRIDKRSEHIRLRCLAKSEFSNERIQVGLRLQGSLAGKIKSTRSAEFRRSQSASYDVSMQPKIMIKSKQGTIDNDNRMSQQRLRMRDKLTAQGKDAYDLVSNQTAQSRCFEQQHAVSEAVKIALASRSKVLCDIKL